MAVLGFDLQPLKDSLANLQQSIRTGVQDQQQGGAGGDYLGYLSGIAPPPPMPAWQALGQVSQRVAPALGGGPASDFLGQLTAYAGGQGVPSPAFDWLANLARIGPAGFGPLGGSADNWAALSAYSNKLAETSTGIGKGAAAVAATATNAAGHPGGAATYTGLPADVAKWANQTDTIFGDLGGWVPAAMLAIIQHESGGSPNAYNGAGDAWGLFQQVGLHNNDPNAQFMAARQLAQQKLAGINAAYAKNGLNPDERTRARDLFLAWAGHFDYGTGQPNASSRDIGSGEDYNAFLNGPQGIMPMYDNVVRGRQQAPAGGAGGDWGAGLLGTPYVMGGLRQHPNNPEQGLDCSEFTAYVWGKHGVTLPWNAQQQYNQTQRVTGDQLQVGDLVFFHGTNPADPDYVTHVGIYMGNGMMINAQDSGVAMTALTSPYWQEHLAGYGRVQPAR